MILYCADTLIMGTSSSNSGPVAATGATAVAAHAVGLPHIGKAIAEQREFVSDPATQIGPHLKHLAAASSASSSLEANLKHITVTLATWDAVWECTWTPAKRSKRTEAEQAAEPTQPTKGKGKAKGKAAKAKTAPQPGSSGATRWLLVFRCGGSTHLLVESQVPPPPSPEPAPPCCTWTSATTPWGRWLDRDTKSCLNFQRVGESVQRPWEMCQWEDLKALPPSGEQYQLRYKLVKDRLPKGRQRLHRAAEYRRGINARALNNLWLDRDTKSCLNFQRVGESVQRPWEMCQWEDLKALPPSGEQYQLRYKLVKDRLPKGRQRLHRAAEYRRGINARALNNLVFGPEGAQVVCDSVSLDLLRGARIEWEESLMRSAFVVGSNPNSEASCGCGSSFTAKAITPPSRQRAGKAS
ncbi:hypothetical protein QJQ45_014141 [Haematococcus lacustris]|nr:hypothetical protein QJQ45_014141 [Haematococcus lacustris]